MKVNKACYFEFYDGENKIAHDDIDAVLALKVTVTNTVHNLLDNIKELMDALNNQEVNKP